ncbi:MAG: NFYB/HAP3 family transcription factor subunit, partial [Burkholderiales bacterium]|nr:NFYB/HAP3 family transcription factor subunit [Burkholderiales bacterium]
DSLDTCDEIRIAIAFFYPQDNEAADDESNRDRYRREQFFLDLVFYETIIFFFFQRKKERKKKKKGRKNKKKKKEQKKKTKKMGEPGELGEHLGLSHEAQSHQSQQQSLAAFWEREKRKIQEMEDFKTTKLPLSRIKRIMKSDEEVRMISTEAPLLFAKACELFIVELTLRAWANTEESKRKTLQRNDIAMAISKTDVYDFLIDIVPPEDLKVSKKADDGLRMAGHQMSTESSFYPPYSSMAPPQDPNDQQQHHHDGRGQPVESVLFTYPQMDQNPAAYRQMHPHLMPHFSSPQPSHHHVMHLQPPSHGALPEHHPGIDPASHDFSYHPASGEYPPEPAQHNQDFHFIEN